VQRRKREILPNDRGMTRREAAPVDLRRALARSVGLRTWCAPPDGPCRCRSIGPCRCPPPGPRVPMLPRPRCIAADAARLSPTAARGRDAGAKRVADFASPHMLPARRGGFVPSRLFERPTPTAERSGPPPAPTLMRPRIIPNSALPERSYGRFADPDCLRDFARRTACCCHWWGITIGTPLHPFARVACLRILVFVGVSRPGPLGLFSACSRSAAREHFCMRRS